jgi:serine/threonine-protein kinase
MSRPPEPGPPEAPPPVRRSRDESVLEVIGRRIGPAPKILLRDSPSEHGGTPLLDAASPEARHVPAGRGNYEVHGEIARGGMGVILKGHDRDLGRDVALKVLKRELAERPEIVSRFVEEAQIGGQLQHPGIVPVYDLGLLADERPYFTMKLVKGRTFAALLAERASPAADRVRCLSILEQVCQTMAYAHSKGVIHRDLKPANVMVGAFGEVQVLDWGLAKVLAQGGVADEKREREHATIIATLRQMPGSKGSDSLAGSVMGTPSYMPPEQARGEIGRLDERSDVFALGAMLCEVLTGAPPYHGDPESVLSRAANGEIDDATRRLDGCAADAELVALAKRCLAPAPPARPRHAGVVATDLAAWRNATEERARAAQIAVAEARVKAEDERRARRLTLALSAALVAIVVLGGGGFALWSVKQRDWTAQTEASVHAALGDATLHRGQKRWPEAQADVQHARALLDAGHPTPQLREKVQEQAALVARETDEASRRADVEKQNRELLAALRALRSPEVAGGNWEEVETGYLDTFAAYGLDLDRLPVADAAKKLQERGIAEAAAAALDEWSYARKQLGRAEDSEHLSDVACAADPDPTRTRLRKAILIGDRKLLREFANDRDLRQFPASSLNLLASAFRRIDLAKESIDILKIARLVHPDDLVVNVNLGWMFFSAVDPPQLDESMQCFSAALAVEPGSPPLQALMGRILVVNLGDAPRGLALLDQALHASPNTEEVLWPHLRTMRELFRLEPMLADARAVVRLAPNDIEAHDELGHALLLIGDYDEALATYREAVRLVPDDGWAHVGVAHALLERGDVDAAAESIESSLRQRVSAYALWLDLAVIRAARGDRDGAKEAFTRGVELCGRNAGFQADAAWAIATCADHGLRDPALAVTLARDAADREPRRAAFQRSLAAALAANGDWKESAAAFERAVKLSDGGIPIDWILLAMAHQKLGTHSEALRWYQKTDEWIEQHTCRNAELLRFRGEARALLGIGSTDGR